MVNILVYRDMDLNKKNLYTLYIYIYKYILSVGINNFIQVFFYYIQVILGHY